MSDDKKSKTGLLALFFKLFGKFFSFIGKSAKLIKLGLAAATFASYSVLFSWKFALLMMFSIGFHESGHVWAMKHKGIATKGFYFLPFMGGVAVANSTYSSYTDAAFVVLMGPIWGAGLAFASAILYIVTGNTMFASAAVFMAMLNLFNLLPINPLDGGQLLKYITFSISNKLSIVILIISLITSIIIFYVFHIFLFAFLTIISLFEIMGEMHMMQKVEKAKQNNVIVYSSDISSYLNKKKMLLTDMFYAAGVYLILLGSLFAIVFIFNKVPGAELVLNFLQ